MPHLSIKLKYYLIRYGEVNTWMYGEIPPISHMTESAVAVPGPGDCVAFVTISNSSRHKAKRAAWNMCPMFPAGCITPLFCGGNITSFPLNMGAMPSSVLTTAISRAMSYSRAHIFTGRHQSESPPGWKKTWPQAHLTVSEKTIATQKTPRAGGWNLNSSENIYLGVLEWNFRSIGCVFSKPELSELQDPLQLQAWGWVRQQSCLHFTVTWLEPPAY